MSGGSVVPESFGNEVSEQRRIVGAPHPVVRVGAYHAVLDVLVGFARRLGRAGRGGHTGHRRPVRGLVAGTGALVIGAMLATVGAPSVQPAERRMTSR